MTKSANRADLTAEELDIVDHAHAVGLHVKKAGRHSGHCWYCFDCQNGKGGRGGCQNVVQHHGTFDSNKAIKHHLTAVHGVHWYSAYYEPEDAA